MLAEEDWTVSDELRIDTHFVKHDLNCYDESALEMALRLSDTLEKSGVNCNLNALTIGGSHLDTWLKKLYALRFDNATRIDSNEDLRFSPETVARIIADYVTNSGSFDLIILGSQGGVGDNAMTPLLLAEYLSLPCVSQVLEITPDSSDSIRTKSALDGEFLVQRIRFPVVLTIGDSPNSYMRVPTLKDKMQHGKRPIEVIDKGHRAEDTVPTARLVGLEPVTYKRDGYVIDGETAEQKAGRLYELLKTKL